MRWGYVSVRWGYVRWGYVSVSLVCEVGLCVCFVGL